LIAVLDAMDDEAAAFGPQVTWDKMKVQALGTHQPDQEVLAGRTSSHLLDGHN